jgi:hypothetical protein
VCIFLIILYVFILLTTASQGTAKCQHIIKGQTKKLECIKIYGSILLAGHEIHMRNLLQTYPLLLRSPALSRTPPISSSFIFKSLSPLQRDRERERSSWLRPYQREMDLLERSTIKAEEGERKEEQQQQQEKEAQQGLTRPPLANGSSR